METKELYSFGPFQIDSAKRLLQRDHKAVPLSTKGFEALLFLVRHSDRLVEKDELMTALWPDTTVEENNLSQSISAIRKALGDSPQAPQYIETVPGWGYRFAAPVNEVSPVEPARFVLRQDALLARPRPGKTLLVWGAALTLILAAGAAAYLLRVGRRETAQNKLPGNSQVLPARHSIAVLGFENLSQDKKDEWLSTALPEMLSTELAAGGTLRIVSGDDVARVKSELPAKKIGSLTGAKLQLIDRKLGSDLLIYGSYAAIGDRSARQIRVDVRLQNANSGDMVTELAETGAEGDLFDLVSRAGVRLRRKLGLSDLSPTEAVVVRASLPANREAVQLYSEGLASLRVFDAMHARDQLLKAIALDPKYPLSHSALADAWSALGYDKNAAEEARIAFQLSGNLAAEDTLLVEGRYRVATREWAQAVEVYQKLFGLFPDDLDYGLQLASTQTAAARARDALATLALLRLLPAPLGQDPRIDLAAAKAWNSLGDFKQMEGVLGNAVKNAQARGDRLLLARARYQQCHAWRFLGEARKAIEACRDARQMYSAAGDRGAEADTLTLLGDVVSDTGVPGAMRIYQHSLDIQRAIGHLSGQATVLNQIAIQYSDGGDHVAATQFFAQALSIFRQLDDRVDATGMMINIASELGSQGKLPQARKQYQETVDAAITLGNKNIQGLATFDMAVIDQLRGDLDRAQAEFEEARKLFEAASDKNQLTTAISGLGSIALAKGDFKTAEELYQSALRIRQSTQQKVPAAESELDLALLSMEKGGPPLQIEGSVKPLLETFRASKAANDEAVATGLLARALLAEGKKAEARATAEQAVAAAATSDRHIRLSIAVTAARVLAGADQSSAARAVATLEKTIAETRKLGYFEIELKARLALGKIELKSGATGRGRERLNAVKKDATQRGFIVLAGQAASGAAQHPDDPL